MTDPWSLQMATDGRLGVVLNISSYGSVAKKVVSFFAFSLLHLKVRVSFSYGRRRMRPMLHSIEILAVNAPP